MLLFKAYCLYGFLYLILGMITSSAFWVDSSMEIKSVRTSRSMFCGVSKGEVMPVCVIRRPVAA